MNMSSDTRIRPDGPGSTPQAASEAARLDDGLYQNGRLVARVFDPQVDLQAREIHFAEAYQSDSLLLPDESEYQKYRILIQKVAFASKLDREAPHKGRILKGVVAEILGYREQ